MPEKTTQKEHGKKTASPSEKEVQPEVVIQIPLAELHPFPDHPFQVRDDDSMRETAESVKAYGVWMNTGTTTGATSSASLTIPFWKSMLISTSEWLFGTPPWSAPPTHCCPAAAWSRENTSSMKIF